MINVLNKKLTSQTSSGSFGPVPSGKEWIIKTMVVEVTVAGAAAENTLEIDGVAIAETEQLLGLGNLGHLVGAGDQAGGEQVKQAFATDGQTVNVIRGSGGGYTWDAHMSYLERDIP